jgi:hypothetical protein
MLYGPAPNEKSTGCIASGNRIERESNKGHYRTVSHNPKRDDLMAHGMECQAAVAVVFSNKDRPTRSKRSSGCDSKFTDILAVDIPKTPQVNVLDAYKKDLLDPSSVDKPNGFPRESAKAGSDIINTRAIDVLCNEQLNSAEASNGDIELPGVDDSNSQQVNLEVNAGDVNIINAPGIDVLCNEQVNSTEASNGDIDLPGVDDSTSQQVNLQVDAPGVLEESHDPSYVDEPSDEAHESAKAGFDIINTRAIDVLCNERVNSAEASIGDIDLPGVDDSNSQQVNLEVNAGDLNIMNAPGIEVLCNEQVNSCEASNGDIDLPAVDDSNSQQVNLQVDAPGVLEESHDPSYVDEPSDHPHESAIHGLNCTHLPVAALYSSQQHLKCSEVSCCHIGPPANDWQCHQKVADLKVCTELTVVVASNNSQHESVEDFIGGIGPHAADVSVQLSSNAQLTFGEAVRDGSHISSNEALSNEFLKIAETSNGSTYLAAINLSVDASRDELLKSAKAVGDVYPRTNLATNIGQLNSAEIGVGSTDLPVVEMCSDEQVDSTENSFVDVEFPAVDTHGNERVMAGKLDDESDDANSANDFRDDVQIPNRKGVIEVVSEFGVDIYEVPSDVVSASMTEGRSAGLINDTSHLS